MTSRPIALDEPHDTCFRCGRRTSAGVPLCEHDNPGRIKGPSTTQVHGTVALGLIGGFVLLFVFLANFVTPGAGLLDGAIVRSTALADGSTEIVVRVTNTSDVAAAASCRVQRGGVVGGGDIVFFTHTIPAGETREFTRTLSAAATGSASHSGTFAVRCS